MRRLTLTSWAFISLILFTAWGDRPFIFRDAPAVDEAGDQKPSPLPPKDSKIKIVEYFVTSAGRYPMLELLDLRTKKRARDINALDQVPASSWFTPRLGFKPISPEELLKGPEEIGPPQPPLTVTKAKPSGSNPGFMIKDSRGHEYLIKVDLAEFPALESTTNFVVNRLFWGFGYNVPEDFIVRFKQEDLQSEIDALELEKVLLFSSPDDDGYYRGTASLWLEGKVLGYTAQKGVRKGDLNDTIPHENRRTLRALRVLCAFTHQTGIRSDNTLDVYKGEAPNGFTAHYLLDFGEALGGHGMNWRWRWDGYEHFFSVEDQFKNVFGLGLKKKNWEKITYTREQKEAFFEADSFSPEKWKEVYQFQPIRHSRPEDDYWAAKLIVPLTEAHLRTLFKAAQYPDKAYEDHLIQTLLIRREKILQWAFSRVTPLESAGIQSQHLEIEDFSKTVFPDQNATEYQIRFYGKNHRKAAQPITITSKEAGFRIPLSDTILQKDYLRIEISRTDSKANSAEFHIRKSENGPRLVGIVR